MFNSTVLEVAIGLVFCYASVALIASSIFEGISSLFALRSKTLFSGIKQLINVDEKNLATHGLLLALYNQALVSPLGDGKAQKIDEIKSKPSYMDSKSFATALIWAIESVPGDFQRLQHDINGMQNDQLKQLLQGFYDSTGGEAGKFQEHLATWFDAGMDRLSGQYKRTSQIWCFFISLAIAGILNIDSISLFHGLWQHPSLVAQLQVTDSAKEAIEELKTLPIGWPEGKSFEIVVLGGWLITASASLFGGPFWFDLLKQLINLRGTGVVPQPAGSSPNPVTDSSLTANGKRAASGGDDSELVSLKNAIIDFNAGLYQADESYRPIQAEERW
ncbi:MAG: hypothetical protein WC782_10110 [Methylococcaceae bacterium]|jgi:hypothetical protein